MKPFVRFLTYAAMSPIAALAVLVFCVPITICWAFDKDNRSYLQHWKEAWGC